VKAFSASVDKKHKTDISVPAEVKSVGFVYTFLLLRKLRLRKRTIAILKRKI